MSLRRILPIAAVAGLVLALAGFSTGAARSTGGPLQVVAAENVWGSLASQLGGSHVHVTSIVTSPATDPHDYEPTAIDARTLAGANLVIVNGAGYDAWATKLLDANPVKDRIVINIGELLGVKRGGNPHFWYSPGDVARVIARLSTAYHTLDPQDAAEFRSSRSFFLNVSLHTYHAELATIRHHFHGTKVGASESIFAPLAAALRLNLVTPRSFLNATSEGSEPTARDLSTVNAQIAKHEIKVWVYNTQNSTPDVQRLTSAARKHHIPIVPVTETLVPPTSTFQAWQVSELEALARALSKR